MIPPPTSRRPIRSRQARIFRTAAAWLAARGVRPDTISQASMGFAALSGLSFCLSVWLPGGAGGFLLLAAVGIQLRLACNLLDGMVAVEHGKGGKAGAFWNEVPDRVSEIAILAGAGIAAGLPALGLLAALGAVMTACLRAAGAAEGLEHDFRGPMAKSHRMALLTGAAVLGIILPGHAGPVLAITLGLVVLGTAWTGLRRARRFLSGLQARSDTSP